MAFWLEGANHYDAWWDLMLLTRLPLALWTLCLIPMSSAFKLLLSEVAVMAAVGRGWGGWLWGLWDGVGAYRQSSFANVFKRAALRTAY